MNYYNENDAKAAAWLQELINQKQIPDGHIDTRSITDIAPGDLSGYTQCHFFAGIGGWSLALQLAGWPADKPVWTGSCPCQPFSVAGKGQGDKDERHLWPVFFDLIRECRPECVIGEQVANAIGKGWLDGVSADLEGAGYACGATVLGAHSVGAPHIRQRLYWVADATSERRQHEPPIPGSYKPVVGKAETRLGVGGGGDSGGLADADGEQADSANTRGLHTEPCSSGDARGMEHSSSGRCEDASQQRRDGREEESYRETIKRRTGGAWSDFDILPCRDGKARRVESGTFPLAHGVPGRVGLLRGYGNAIVPQAAAAFIQAFCETN